MPAWAAPNGSCGLSSRRVKPLSPALLPQRGEPVAPTGEDLVRIGLVADVPEDLVRGRVEDVVEGQRQLDGAQVGRQVPPGLGHGPDDQLADLLRHLGQDRSVKLLEIGR